ncbi:trigger factor [Candidatus Saccharibacteria bacterium]|nr:trigger factor [Candidatus Saccharibacteria bacterium]
MRISKTEESATRLKLLITADQFDLTPIKDHVLKHFASKVKVPGFRVGTAPVALIEKHVDQRALADEFIEHALNSLYGRAIDQEKLRPASRPEVHLKKFVPFTDLEFEAELEIIGPIKLPDYKKIKLVKKPVEIRAEEISSVIESLRLRLADRKAVERAAKDGDEVVIDFEGKDKMGDPIAGADGKDYPLMLGGATHQTVRSSGKFIPGFEENLIGTKAGGKYDFTITFPNDYGAVGLRNKEVTFTVGVKKVNEVTRPKLDDAFAAKVGLFKTMADLEADIKKQLKAEKQMPADREYENELIIQISEKTEVEVPKSLVDEQIARGEEDEKRDLAYRGQTWQEHLDAEGITAEGHFERQRPEAQQRVKAGLVLSEIAERENIFVTPEELEIRIQILKGQYQDPQMQAELDKPENQREIAARLMTEKTVARLVEFAQKS